MTLRLQGRDVKATSEVLEETGVVAEGLSRIFAKAPEYARYLQVKRGSTGPFDIEQVKQAAQSRVLIRTRLL